MSEYGEFVGEESLLGTAAELPAQAGLVGLVLRPLPLPAPHPSTSSPITLPACCTLRIA